MPASLYAATHLNSYINACAGGYMMFRISGYIYSALEGSDGVYNCFACGCLYPRVPIGESREIRGYRWGVLAAWLPQQGIFFSFDIVAFILNYISACGK